MTWVMKWVWGARWCGAALWGVAEVVCIAGIWDRAATTTGYKGEAADPVRRASRRSLYFCLDVTRTTSTKMAECILCGTETGIASAFAQDMS